MGFMAVGPGVVIKEGKKKDPIERQQSLNRGTCGS